MKDKFGDLLTKFERKGFNNIEVTGFVSDFRDLKLNMDLPALNSLNLELEGLGWGVHVMDMALYKDLISLFEKEAIEDFNCYLQQLSSQYDIF